MAQAALTQKTGLSPAVALLALPLVGLALLLALPAADLHWQHNPAHFWLVLIAASLNVILAYSTGAAARRRGDGRVHLVSLAFLAAAAFLGLHALATPGVLLDAPNLGFAISTPTGLVLAGALAAASALDLDRLGTARVLQLSKRIERALLAAIAFWTFASLAWTPELEDVAVPERLSAPLLALSILGIALYVFAVTRYLALYRARRSTLLLAFAVAFALLAEAMTAVAVSRNWQLSWWEWHVLMLIAFAVIAFGAHREWHEERFGALYLDRAETEVTVLFADLQGFTAFSERHGPEEVTRMLNAYFEAAIPAVERHGGNVDRLIGDAVMAIFEGTDDHPERAARAALALQEAAETVAAAQPAWPRFRVGLNTGSASAGVLGRSPAAGRTASSGTPSTSPPESRASPPRAASRSEPRRPRASGARSSSRSARSRSRAARSPWRSSSF